MIALESRYSQMIELSADSQSVIAKIFKGTLKCDTQVFNSTSFPLGSCTSIAGALAQKFSLADGMTNSAMGSQGQLAAVLVILGLLFV
jgi:hypothetical protein